MAQTLREPYQIRSVIKDTTTRPNLEHVVSNETTTYSVAAIVVADTTVATLSIPPNLLGTNNMLEIEGMGVLTNSSGAARNYTLKVSYGGTNIATLTLSAFPAAGNGGFYFKVTLKGDGATNAQKATSMIWGEALTNTGALGTSAVDSTSAQNLVITIATSNATVTQSFFLERILITRFPNTA